MAIFFMSLFFIPCTIAQNKTIGMVTGSEKGTYFKFGNDIADIARRNGLDIKVKTSEGSMKNIRRLPSRENAGLGIVQSDVLSLLRRSETPEDHEIAQKLRLIFTLYNEEVHLFANKNIKDFKDLQGKRLVVGVEDSGNYVTSTNLMSITGIEPRKIHLKPEKALEAVLHGRADAMIYVVGKPASLFREIESKYPDKIENVHFVPLNDKKILREYKLGEITSNDYKWLEEKVSTVTIKAVLICYDFTRKDEPYYHMRCEQFAKLARIIRDNIGELKQGAKAENPIYHPKWKQVNLNEDMGIWEWDTCSRSSGNDSERSSIRMVTASKMGTYFKFGKDIGDIARRNGLKITVDDSHGSIANINHLTRTYDRADLAIVQSDVLSFLKRYDASDYQEIAQKLRLIFTLYNEEVHLFANKDIKHFKDLQGKRLVVGLKGSGNYLTSTNLLNITGITPLEKIEHLEPKEAVKAVLLGRTDAMIYVIGKPAPLFSSIEKVKSKHPDLVENVHFVPLNDKKILGEYKPGEITSDDYTWLKENQRVPTVTVKAALICNDYTQEDINHSRMRCKQFKKLARIIRGNIDKLQRDNPKYHPKWNQVNLDEDMGIWEWDTCSRVDPIDIEIDLSSPVDPIDIEIDLDSLLD